MNIIVIKKPQIQPIYQLSWVAKFSSCSRELHLFISFTNYKGILSKVVLIDFQTTSEICSIFIQRNYGAFSVHNRKCCVMRIIPQTLDPMFVLGPTGACWCEWSAAIWLQRWKIMVQL